MNPCACGCGALVAGKWKRGHNQKVGPQYVVQEDGCWRWLRAISGGYGRVAHPTRRGTMLAHRWSYELARGPIPAGLVLDHICGFKACVNPAHLEPVTQAVNVQRTLRDFGARLAALEGRIAELQFENAMLKQMAAAKAA